MATSAYTKGTKPCFPIFSYGNKKNCCQRGAMPNGPPKFATVMSAINDMEDLD